MADGNQHQRGQPRKKNSLDEYKFRLIGDPVNGSRRPPTLGFSVVKNQVQIDVRTNVENDKDYGRISAKLDSPTFFAVLVKLDEVIDAPPDTKYVLENTAIRFVNGQRTDPKLDTRVLLGKDRDGVVFIGVTSWEKERPIVKFPFRPSQFHSWARADGTLLSPAELSQLYARGYVRELQSLVPVVLETNYVEPPPRENRGGYGGNRGGGSGGGSSNNRQQTWGGGDTDKGLDDDFPM